MTRSIPMEKALDDCLVAFTMNGEALRPEQGYPLRLVVPGWEGNMWVKWLRRIEVGDQPWHAPRGNLEIHRPAGERKGAALHLGDGCQVGDHQSRARRRRSPTAKGRPVLTGLAWSGRGTIKRVDVSLDGGRNWQHGAARRAEPVDKSLHRFYLRLRLGRSDRCCCSRAPSTDTGYVQPTKDELRAVRGDNSIYHNNGIQTWHVNKDGEVENVEVS